MINSEGRIYRAWPTAKVHIPEVHIPKAHITEIYVTKFCVIQLYQPPIAHVVGTCCDVEKVERTSY